MWALWLVMPAHAEILGVSTDGEVRGDRVEWTTTVVSDTRIVHVDLAAPLPEDAVLLPQAGKPVYTDGRVTGFDFDRMDSYVVLRVEGPLHPDDGVHAAPIVDTSAVQRLSVSGGTLLPDGALGFGRTLDDLRQPGLDEPTTRVADHVLGKRRVRHPAYFVADERFAGGLRASIRTEDATGSAVWWVGAGALGTVLFAALAAWHTLKNALRAEENEAYIRNHLPKAAPTGEATTGEAT